MSKHNDYHYHPVDNHAAEWGFHLTTTGRVLHPVTSEMPHGVHPEMYMFDVRPSPSDAVFKRSPRICGRILPEFGAIFITETHAIFESDETGIIEFDGSTLLFLFPGVWHRYRPIGSDKKWLTSRWIGFNGDTAHRLLSHRSISPETAVYGVANALQLTAAFDCFVDRVASNPAADPMLLSMRGLDLLVDCIESAQDGTNMRNLVSTAKGNSISVDSSGEQYVTRMLDLIWTGSHRDLTMDQLCELVGSKRRSMERWFAASRGHSLLTEMALCRCQRARHFLENTDLQIKNVRWLAGFRSSDQMRMNFLNVVGMSPDQYRQTHRREPR